MKSYQSLAIAFLLFSGCAAVGGPVVDNAKNPAVTPLVKPEAGKGFQIYMSPFEIAPEEEKEVFIYKNSPITERQYINKVQFSMREGSHHFILYTLNGAYEQLTDGQTRTDIEQEMQRQTRSFVFGAQNEQTTYNFPPGVAMVMEPGQGLDLNAHYVNPTNELYKGEAYINLYTVPQSEVQHVAIPKLDVDTKFSIPAHSTYTRKYNWGAFGKTTHLFLLTSHAHKRMLLFKIFKIHAGDTTQIYETRNWHEPDVNSDDIIFEPNDMIYSETTWRNESDQPVRFGFSADDEMNVIYGYYWQ